MSTVFYVSNTNRKDKYLIETRIQDRNGSLQVEKRASVPESIPHLEHMIQSYDELSRIKKLTKLVSIVAPLKLAEDRIKFDFINGVSAERILLEKVLNEDNEAAADIINRLYAVVDALPELRANPAKNPAYNKVFSNSFDGESACASIGLLDLNLDNFIVDVNGRWHLYDYEWVFEFPVPKLLLQARLVWYFLYRHKEILKYYSAGIESMQVGKDLFVPVALLPSINDQLKYFKDLCNAEYAFQAYTAGQGNQKFLVYAEAGFDVKNAKPSVRGMEEFVQKNTHKINQELQQERQRRIKVEKRLSEITSSKSYKLARKLQKSRAKLPI